MNKDFTEDQLLKKTTTQQLKVLYDLASYIEKNQIPFQSSHFDKLRKYHHYLQGVETDKIQKVNKEFAKVKDNLRQFQLYLMQLERLLGQSTKEYEFLVRTQDHASTHKTFPVICLLDSIRSAHNVGAMFRNAECFGNEKLILTGLSPTPETAQVKKTAMQTEQMLPWEHNPNAIEVLNTLKKEGYHIWAIETSPKALDLGKLDKIPTPLILVFGHELHGISLDILKLCDEIIQIPLFGKKNSLNVSVTQGIVLNQITQRLNN